MSDSLRAHAEAYRAQLDRVIQRGHRLQAQLQDSTLRGAPPDTLGLWQKDCAVLISQLSGGSKAHWLARAYSEAFLVRSTTGRVVVEADAVEIAGRILQVLAQARQTVSSLAASEELAAACSGQAATPRRFDFVHNVPLRPVLEQALADTDRALENRDFTSALLTACVVLEAIITDALEATTAWEASSAAEWSFERRILAAEAAGLIRGGCARLPPVARAYRELAGETHSSSPEVAVAEHEARVTSQVLRVVMRDLNPGR